MTRISFAHILPCDAATFWAAHLSDDWNAHLFGPEGLGFASYTPMAHVEGPERTVRRQRCLPRPESVPPHLRRWVGDGLGYVEDGTWDALHGAAPNGTGGFPVYAFRTTLDAMPNRARIEGAIWCQERAGQPFAVRVADIIVDVRVPLVGAAIERQLAADITRSYEAMPAILGRYLQRQPVGAVHEKVDRSAK